MTQILAISSLPVSKGQRADSKLIMMGQTRHIFTVGVSFVECSDMFIVEIASRPGVPGLSTI